MYKPKKINLKNIVVIDETYQYNKNLNKEDNERAKHYHDVYRSPKIIVEINEKTRQADIKQAWPHIKKMQKNLRGYKERYRENEYLERDKRIIELYEQKKTSKEISQIIENEDYGYISPSHIRNIIDYYYKDEVCIRSKPNKSDKLKVIWL